MTASWRGQVAHGWGSADSPPPGGGWYTPPNLAPPPPGGGRRGVPSGAPETRPPGGPPPPGGRRGPAQLGLVPIVDATPQLDVVDRRFAAHTIGLHVVKLQESLRTTAPAVR